MTKAKGNILHQELKALRSIGDSTGFFSHGEFLREKGMVNQHNLTLVVASLREGEKKEYFVEAVHFL